MKSAWIVSKKTELIVNTSTNFSQNEGHTFALRGSFIHFSFFNDSNKVKLSIMLVFENDLP